jgi:sulfate adenylyltransferase subunit 2
MHGSLARAEAVAQEAEAAPVAAHAAHLDGLEAEAIHILREVVAECRRPVMLYSAGKDSSVMLHLARKAFFPAPPPFPLLHVDTCWEFQAMYAMRDRAAAEAGMELIVHRNPEALARGINPFDHGPLHTDLWKTEGLRQALDAHGFDAAFGGARRDEEASRAKERVVSLRAPGHRWDPKRQRPELWNLYNCRTGPGETLRVFPLSNWTERDVWLYAARERLALVPLYFAEPRPTVVRDGLILVVDEPERMRLRPAERVVERRVRFRSLGCWPLTGAVESDAATIGAVIAEVEAGLTSERHGRAIDRDQPNAMERKKQEGYF